MKLPDMGNMHMDDSTTSIIIFVVVALIIFAIFRKLLRWLMLFGVVVALFYLLK